MILAAAILLGFDRPPAAALEVPIQLDVIHFAVIGDFGSAGDNESDVAALIKGWDPDFIVTVGDNNYPDGAASTIDRNVGQYFHEFIHPYLGEYGPGADVNRFFPALGNHDWDTPNAQPYLDYFTLPGNERYYDFIRGPVHFFVIDSDPREPDGITSTSIQAQWLRSALASSTSPWNLVILHHAPYSSGKHGSNPDLQWPYAEWGADAVLSGHDHTYERIIRDGIPYLINGLGGGSIYSFEGSIEGSRLRFNDDYGAMLVAATPLEVVFQFVTRTGNLVDTHTLKASHAGTSNVFRELLSGTLKLIPPTDRPTSTNLLPPDTYIALNYIEITEGSTISFRFYGTKPGHFLCSLDGSAFSPCTSPQVYRSLPCGEHRFQVRAVDERGVMDATPASYNWEFSAGADDEGNCQNNDP